MKNLLFLFVCVCSLVYVSCQSPTHTSSQETEADFPEEKYDSLLAQRVGADDYGMKSYIFAFLKTGPNRSQDSVEVAKLMRGHLDNITRLAEESKLVLAGPYLDDGEIRGIYIFNTESIEEARTWTESDPAIKAGSLVMELKPWYGSASLDLVNEWHKKIQKKGI